MILELKPEELNRLDDLLSNTWSGKKPFLSQPDKIKITPDQVLDVKRRLADGQAIINITRDTNISEYHIRGVRRRRYDFLLVTAEKVMIVKHLLTTNKTDRTISAETGISKTQIYDIERGVYNCLLE